MPCLRSFAMIGALALGGCGGSTEPRTNPTLPLEPVPYEALGTSGRVSFVRQWIDRPLRLGDEEYLPPYTLYTLDVGARSYTRQEIRLEAGPRTPLALSPNGRNGAYISADVFSPPVLLRMTLGGRLPAASIAVATLPSVTPIAGVVWTGDSERILYRRAQQSGVALVSQRRTATGDDVQIVWQGPADADCSRSPAATRGPMSVHPSTGAILMTCADTAIYVLDAGASTARRLYRTSATAGTTVVHGAVWSPDGQRIALVEDHLLISQRAIRLHAGDGSPIRTIVTFLASGPLSIPCWMPAGDRIVYSVTAGGTHLYVAPITGTGVSTRITSEPLAVDTDVSCGP